MLVNRGSDEVLIEDIETSVIYKVMFSVFKVAYKRVWKTGEVAKFLMVSPRSLYRYEANGQIKKPKRYASYGDRQLRFYTKQDVLEIHELVGLIHQGRPRKDGRIVNNKLPTKASLLTMFRERFGE